MKVLGNDAKDSNRGASSAELFFARQSDPKTLCLLVFYFHSLLAFKTYTISFS